MYISVQIVVKMHSRLFLSVSTLACLLASLSCNKEDKTLPVQTKDVPFEEAIGLSTLFPELETMSSIQYDEKTGYYIPFTQIEWNQGWTSGPVFIPSQTLSFDTKATLAGDAGWYVNDISDVVLSDVQLPSLATKFSWGNCYSAVKLHIALDENVPYQKVILHDFSVRFPDGFMARLDGAEGGVIRNLEVTAEGVDVPIWLSSIQNPEQFEDNDGKTCFSVGTGFEACVSVSPEDAAGAVSVKPSELNFRCTLEFEQVDFVSCRLSFQEDATPVAGSFEWNAAKLPSFLCGENADITLSNPRIVLDYQSDFPFSWARHDFAVLYGDDKAGFSCSGPSGQITETLEPFFHSPFREGNLQPEFFYQPVLTGEAPIVPGQNYSMRAKIDLAVPLAFTGNIDAKAVSTPSLQLNGDALGAPANSTHMIKQKVGSTLPVDCRITPVFTMEGEEPVSLDEFILDAKHREVEFSHSFRPAKDHWTATLSYLVTPIRGTGEYLMKADRQCLTVGDCSFTANYREE